ncbi:putative hydantoinase/oxoprolinase, partial [Coniochaeta sp. 2T2.1]
MYRIGVDVGGTNTDAAILDIAALDTPGRGVLASCKSSTTADITSGITSAIGTVLEKCAAAVPDAKGGVLSVTIGTTHFVNALIEADSRRLARVAVVRLCGPFTRQIPPFSDFPVGLRRIMDGGAYYLDGGLEIDGREIAPLNPAQIAECVRSIRESGATAVALVGVFSPLDHGGLHEEACKRQMLALHPDLDIVCSQGIGPPGLLERENATILNAAILATARWTINGFKTAMKRLELSCPLYLSQNDGTLIDADAAARFPIKTFASGPTNSMTGAAFLAGLDKPKVLKLEDGVSSEDEEEERHQVLVVDIGGTTTDVCALLPSGFPRQAPNFIEVGGVRTAFSMPEVVSIGLGGGSKVFTDPKGTVNVGPDSVGHYLTEQALVFGGPTLTTSDVAVASGKAQLGDPTKVAGVPESTVQDAKRKIKAMLESVIEQMKVSAAPVHVLLVGGGSLLVTEDLDNVAKCTRPIHHGAANAVGAAIAKVAGEVDIIEILDGKDEKLVLASACEKAMKAAVDAGAEREDVKIVAVEKIPLQYTSNRATRIIVKAIGRLAAPKASVHVVPTAPSAGVEEIEQVEVEGAKVHVADAATPTNKPSLHVDLASYRPEVRDSTWYISEVDLELIAIGTGILGTGGGGPSYHELLKGLQILRTGGKGKMRVVAPGSLQDSDLVCFGSWYGAPSVINERIASGHEISNGIDTLKKIMGIQTLGGVLTDEIGGGNGLSAFPTGVHYDIPVIDGDGMGRAYPTMYHVTMYVYGHPITPCALTDSHGNPLTISFPQHADSPTRVERLLRTAAVELGLGCAACSRPLEASIIKKYAMPNTISQAWYLGRAVHLARRNKTKLTDAIFDTTPGKVFFTGKIVDVRRDIGGGYTMGNVLLAPLEGDEQDDSQQIPSPATTEKRHMFIPFQNEYLYAVWADASGKETDDLVCTVPELISILGQDGEAIGSQELRYGLRVTVIGMPAHPLWKTEKGLAVGGPAGFGLDIPFKGVGEYSASRSVIEEFG